VGVAAMKAVVFFAVCLAATPLVAFASAALTTLWYEKVYLPRIADMGPSKPADYSKWPQ
jgi:hypothetical protein